MADGGYDDEVGEEFRPGREGEKHDEMEEERAREEEERSRKEKERARKEEERERNERQGARKKTKKVDGKTYTSLEDDDEGDKSVLYAPGEDGVLFYEATDGDGKFELKETEIGEAWGRINEKYNCNPKGAPFVATLVDGKVHVALLHGKKLTPTFYQLFKKMVS